MMKRPRSFLPVGAAFLALVLCQTACVRVTPPGARRTDPHAVPPIAAPAPARPLPAHPQPVPPAHHATPAVPTPASAIPLDSQLAIQIRLDREHCSPGGIDGRWGGKSKRALAAWQARHGHPATGEIDAAALHALGGTNRILTTYAVTAADHASLTPAYHSWLDRSHAERIGYTSIEELVAEKFHLYQAALRQLNPDAAWPNPPAGTRLRVADIQTKPLPPVARIEIRLQEKTLQAFDAENRLVAHFPCSIAADKLKRSEGQTMHVTVWAEHPEYTYDPELFADDPESARIGKRLRIPPGPNNPVGVAWIGLDRPGYGIHGTPSPEDISHTQSRGCFRLTNWDVTKLVHAVKKGVPVTVLP